MSYEDTIKKISAIRIGDKSLGENFIDHIPQTPQGMFVSIIMLRETKSFSIFTTETGEQQDIERTRAGLTNTQGVDRLVMFKRKQVAPERRAGKALLRQAGVFPFATLLKGSEAIEIGFGEEQIAKLDKEKAKKDHKLQGPYNDCYLTEGLCTHCPDCLVYGYAAIEGEGARKARIMTDSCFSIRPYALIQKHKHFNVIDEKKQTSGTITRFDYSQPEIVLPSVITTVDLTLNEFIYTLGNVLRTTRYGKESSRQGFMRNHVVAMAFSDAELFANLEFTQALYDALSESSDGMSEELSLESVKQKTPKVIEKLTSDVFGRKTLLQGKELESLFAQVRTLYSDESQLFPFLKALHTQTASFQV